MIHYRTITTNDPEYAAEKMLRNRVLRLPLGLELSGADLCGEDEQVHIVGMDEQGQVIACVLIAFIEGVAKVRQLAVDDALRGQRIGAELMQRVEDVVKERGIQQAMLHARVTAQKFFEKLGYTASSDIFTEVTIPHVKMQKDLLRVGPSWLSSWMKAHGIDLWGIADLRQLITPCDENGLAFPYAVSFAIPMHPGIMAGIRQGPGPSYADEFVRVNENINTTGSELEQELHKRGHRAMRLKASERVDAEMLKANFPHKTAATRAGLGWIGKNCQLVTHSHGPWVRLGTVLMDLKGPCGQPVERSFCGACVQCVEACPAKALKESLWHPGMPREEILDAHACDRWKKTHFPDYLDGRLCGICSAACPFGMKRAKGAVAVK